MSTFTDMDCNEVKYDDVTEAMDEPFNMKLGRIEARAVIKAMRQGIDSHLEACFVPARGDSCSAEWKEIARLDGQAVCSFSQQKLLWHTEFEISAESMPTLLRRLFESDDPSAWIVASDMLGSIMRDDDDDDDDD